MYGIVNENKIIKLPSNGMIEGLPSEVSIRPITGREELKMNSTSISKYIDLIIKSCTSSIDGTELDTDRLTTPDKTYILFMIRSITYSDEYVDNITCRSCNHEHKASIELSKLKVDYLDNPLSTILDNVVLPKSGIQISLKLPTDSDRAQLEIDARKLAAELGSNYDETYSMLWYVAHFKSFTYTDPEVSEITVDAEEPGSRASVQGLINALSGGDIAEIDKLIRKANDYGITMSDQYECPKCNYYNNVMINIANSEFFRPSSE